MGMAAAAAAAVLVRRGDGFGGTAFPSRVVSSRVLESSARLARRDLPGGRGGGFTVGCCTASGVPIGIAPIAAGALADCATDALDGCFRLALAACAAGIVAIAAGALADCAITALADCFAASLTEASCVHPPNLSSGFSLPERGASLLSITSFHIITSASGESTTSELEGTARLATHCDRCTASESAAVSCLGNITVVCCCCDIVCPSASSFFSTARSRVFIGELGVCGSGGGDGGGDGFMPVTAIASAFGERTSLGMKEDDEANSSSMRNTGCNSGSAVASR